MVWTQHPDMLKPAVAGKLVREHADFIVREKRQRLGACPADQHKEREGTEREIFMAIRKSGGSFALI